MLSKNQIINDRYRLIHNIGRGSFGEVWFAHDMMADIDVAIKFYTSILDPNGLDEFKREFQYAHQLSHQNLLRLDHLDCFGNQPFLVMSYCPKSSNEYLGKIAERDLWKFIYDVSGGLEYLHSRDALHRDIKPSNILQDQDGTFVISDFGLSTKLRSTLRRASSRQFATPNTSGTVPYMAPEMFTASPLAVKATDIWALGASIYELATSELPFCGQGGIMELHGAQVPDLPSDYSPRLNQVMRQCLAKDAWDRPTAKDLREIASMVLTGNVNTNEIDESHQFTDSTIKEDSKDKHNSSHDESKKRNGCITVWLWVAVLMNAAFAVFYVTKMFETSISANALGFGFMSVFGIANILGAVLLMRWNKIGFYIFLISNIVAVLISVAVLNLSAVDSISLLFAIIIWFAILQIRRDGQSAWSLMDSGWNYSQNKKVYNIFGGLMIILILLSFFAFWKTFYGYEEVKVITDMKKDYDDRVISNDLVDDIAIMKETAAEDARYSEGSGVDDIAIVEEEAPPVKIEEILREVIRQERTELPIDIAYGIKITDIKIEPNYITYITKCDEDLVDIDLLNSNKADAKNNVKQFLRSNNDAEMADFLKLCKMAHKGMAYLYVGDTSGKACRIEISYSEL